MTPMGGSTIRLVVWPKTTKYLISITNKLFVYFKIDHSAYDLQPRIFALRSYTGCDLNLVVTYRTMTSPAYQMARYPFNQVTP